MMWTPERLLVHHSTPTHRDVYTYKAACFSFWSPFAMMWTPAGLLGNYFAHSHQSEDTIGLLLDHSAPTHRFQSVDLERITVQKAQLYLRLS
jgi:hypothetical protein